MPTILLKKSDTPGSVPGTANLTNLAGGVEVAVNTADKRVYSMTSASAVIELGTNPSSLTCADVSATVFRSASATITNLIATSASITTLTNNPTFGAGTANGVLYLNGSKVATSGTALVFDGTDFKMPNGGSMLLGASASGASLLLINGTAAAQRLVLGTSGTDAVINATRTSGTSPNLLFQLEGANSMALTSTGLGIGTASPAYQLTVLRRTGSTITAPLLNLQSQTSGSVDGDSFILYGTQTANWAAGVDQADSNKFRIEPSTTLGAADGLTITTAGNLGIGTASPAAKFETFNSAVNTAFVPNTASTWRVAQIRNDGTGTAGSAAGIAFVGRTDVQPAGIAAIQSSTGGGNTSLSFMYVGGNATTEGMRLDNSGNLGIGTASPAAPLHVSYTGEAGLRLSNTSGTPSDWYLQTLNGGVLRWYSYTASTERMQIDGSGNLGLGVTPSLWNSAYRAMNIGSRGFIFSRTDSQETSIGVNWYRTTGAAFVYAQNGYATSYVQTDGVHAWYNSTNNTSGANAALTLIQAMTLDASGNLGVGTTSPGNFSGTVKLVVGSAATTTTAGAVTVYSGTATYGGLYFADGTVGDQLYRGAVEYNHSTDALLLYSAGAERARITAGGYFKASNDGTYNGSTANYHELKSTTAGLPSTFIQNTNANPYGAVINFTSSPDNNSNYFLNCEDGTTVRCYIWSDGDLANHDGVYGTISDERLKQDIVDANSQWDDLKSIRFRKYRMKTDVEANPDAPAMFGVVAQELAQVCPGLVDEHPNMKTVEVTDEEGNVTQTQEPDGTTTMTVKSSILLMKAAKALQEAMARIESLEADMAALKASA